MVETCGQLEAALSLPASSGIYFTKCASLDNRFISGGVVSHRARAKTNSTKREGGDGLPGVRKDQLASSSEIL